MFERIKTYLLYGKHFCGVEHTSKNNEAVIHVTILKKKKKEVDVKDSFSSKSNKNAAKKLPKKQSIFLIINDEHVLTKVFDNESLDGTKLVNKAFPNINISEFYYEIIQQDTKCFISICRKAYVGALIKSYTDLDIYVVHFSFGNSIVSNTIAYIDNEFVSTSNALVSLRNNSIETIELVENIKETHYNINGLNTSNTYLLSLSGALTRILSTYNPIINFQEKRNELITVFKQIRFFNQFLKVGSVFILGVLLVNFLFFNFYFNNVKALNETSQLNQTTKSKIIKLNETVGKAQKMTDDMLKSSASKSSFYINAIVKSLPESILLSEINYQPLEKNIKRGKTIVLNQNTIIVSGASNNSTSYSKWITLLEAMTWINNVEVDSYSDSKTSSSLFSVEINIAL